MIWLKGNLHTHTDASDGDSPPLEVARWYADHGYDFLVISDHNVRVAVEEIADQLREEGKPILLVPGEELTSSWEGPERTHALHVGGIDTSTTLGPSGGGSVVEVLQAMVDKVAGDGGVPSLNHPNFRASISAADISRLRRLQLFEIFNGHPLANNLGTEGSPSLEEVWDFLLVRGQRMLGVAVDDAHDFRKWGPEHRNPGRGWVAVEVDRLEVAEVVTALTEGRFYASTGPVLASVEPREGALAVAVEGGGLIEFIADGQVVASHLASTASHTIPVGGYVRVRVGNDAGTAWTQPAFGSQVET